MESELTLTVSPKRSGWVAARALFRAPDGFLRQAHTSPIYLSIDDRPAASKDDANYMLRWIDQLATIATSHADHFPDDQTRQATLEIYAEARAKYEHVIEQAQLRWGD